MTTIELTKIDGTSYLYQLETGWEIYDKGDEPALWSNYKEGRNLDCAETYKEIKSKLGV